MAEKPASENILTGLCEVSREIIYTILVCHRENQATKAFQKCQTTSQAEYLTGKFLPIFKDNPDWQEFILNLRSEVIAKLTPEPLKKSDGAEIKYNGQPMLITE